MDGLLQKYTGLGLEQLPSDLDREGYYLESTGCYYLVHGDALLFTCPELESGLRQEDGTVQLRYRFPMAQDAHMLWTLTLRPAEGQLPVCLQSAPWAGTGGHTFGSGLDRARNRYGSASR